MIKTEIYEQVLFETVKRGATEISADVKEAFEAAIARESNPDAKNGLIATLIAIASSVLLFEILRLIMKKISSNIFDQSNF